MAHFAELDKENRVIRVIVVDNVKCIDSSIKFSVVPTQEILKQVSGKLMTASVVEVVKEAVGKVGDVDYKEEEIAVVSKEAQWESESAGIAYCERLFGGIWIQTSYNGNIRKNYAGSGYTYDAIRDAFIAPSPFKSWVLDEKTCQWIAPIPYPDDKENMYYWNEEKQNWILGEK